MAKKATPNKTTLEITHVNILADAIYQQRGLLLPTKSRGRARGYYNKYIFEFCLLIAECLTGQRKHVHYSTDYDLGGSKGLGIRFNKSGSFDNLNSEMRVFVKTDSYSTGKYNKAYKINQFWLQRLDALLPITSAHKLSTAHTWHEYEYLTPITISKVTPNIVALAQLYGTCTQADIERRVYIWALINCYRHNGNITQYYDVSGSLSGRYWTKGALGLQQLNRNIRDIVLLDYTEYDMKAAAYAILLSLVHDKSKYPTISSYVEDTQAARLRISVSSGVTVGEVKLVFLHQSFGSSLGYRNSIYQQIGKKALAAIKSNSEFDLFRTEFKAMTVELKRAKSQIYQDVKSYRKSIGKKTFSASFMAKLYQDIECNIACLIRDQLSDKEDCLLLHDGVFTKEHLDCKILSVLIKQELNVDIQIGRK